MGTGLCSPCAMASAPPQKRTERDEQSQPAGCFPEQFTFPMEQGMFCSHSFIPQSLHGPGPAPNKRHPSSQPPALRGVEGTLDLNNPLCLGAEGSMTKAAFTKEVTCELSLRG